MGRLAAFGAGRSACRRPQGLPRLGARGPPPQAGRDECAATRDGGDAELRPVQSRPADLCGIETGGRGAVVRAALAAVRARLRTPIPCRLTRPVPIPRIPPAP